jgi:hypothetical protein
MLPAVTALATAVLITSATNCGESEERPEDPLSPYPFSPVAYTVSPEDLVLPDESKSVTIEGRTVALTSGMFASKECPSETNRCWTRVLYAPDAATLSWIYLDEQGFITEVSVHPLSR